MLLFYVDFKAAYNPESLVRSMEKDGELDQSSNAFPAPSLERIF